MEQKKGETEQTAKHGIEWINTKHGRGHSLYLDGDPSGRSKTRKNFTREIHKNIS